MAMEIKQSALFKFHFVTSEGTTFDFNISADSKEAAVEVLAKGLSACLEELSSEPANSSNEPFPICVRSQLSSMKRTTEL